MSDRTEVVRHLKAVQTPEPKVGFSRLTVTGQAYVPTTNTVASLKKKQPQGLNPTILLLDLVEKQEGIGGQVFEWKAIEPYEQEEMHAQIREVEVFWKGEVVGKVDVGPHPARPPAS